MTQNNKLPRRRFAVGHFSWSQKIILVAIVFTDTPINQPATSNNPGYTPGLAYQLANWHNLF